MKLDVDVGSTKGNIKTEVVADTGAEVTAGGEKHLKHLGLEVKDLTPPDQELQHAGGKALQILGSYPIKIKHNNEFIDDEIYFAKGIRNIYLSCDSCIGIHLVHKEFPNVNVMDIPPQIDTNASLITNPKPADPRPFAGKRVLPCAATEENIPRIESYLLETFSSSAFNITDPIPYIGKPMSMHLKENAEPYATYTPIPTPVHLREAMTDQLKRYVRNKIFRKVEVGEADEWCAKAVTVMKKDGKPRSTVDYQKLNEQCEREAYHTPRPFDVVSCIPSKTFKTVLDAYSGYHQVLLDDESVKLTTFITDLGGRYQSLRAPQGFKGSGDAFNRRYDDIIVDVPRKGKVVDDTILWDDDIAQAFFHTFDFLILCAEKGVTLKPQKFRFCKKEVDFCGYTVGWEGFRPSDESISAIRDFPMPNEPTITDIRSWFGLVNQLAPFIATASMMAPFRDLLKSTNLKGRKVYWDAELQNAFEKTKEALCEMAMDGLRHFDMTKEQS